MRKVYIPAPQPPLCQWQTVHVHEYIGHAVQVCVCVHTIHIYTYTDRNSEFHFDRHATHYSTRVKTTHSRVQHRQPEMNVHQQSVTSTPPPPSKLSKPTGSLGHVNISLFLSSTNSCYFMQTKISLFFSATNSCYFKQLLSATNSCCSTRRPRFRFSFLQLTGASSHTPRFHFSFLQLTATASHRHR